MECGRERRNPGAPAARRAPLLARELNGPRLKGAETVAVIATSEFVFDSPLEEDGFDPSVPLWPRSVRGGPTVSLLPLQTCSGQPRSLADYGEASARNSSALKRIDADARFSSKCAIEEVPGIGSMAGERCSSQASAIWPGVAPRRGSGRSGRAANLRWRGYPLPAGTRE